MAEIIIMPKLGFNMSEGKLVKWYKNVGDAVKKGEPLFSVETDKTNIDIEATDDFTVRKLLVEEGDKVPVTLPIAIVGTAEEEINMLLDEALKQLNKSVSLVPDCESLRKEDSILPISPFEASLSEANNSPKTENNRLKITPRARKKAAELNLSFDDIDISGTGFDGGICEKDIILYADSIRNNKQRITPLARKKAEIEGINLSDVNGSGAGGKIMSADISALMSEKTTGSSTEAIKMEDSQFTPDGKEILEVIPYSGVRKIIGDRLSESKFTSPHMYFTQKVNLENLLDLRKQINESQDRKTSVTDYITKAAIIALQKYPEMNSSLIDGNIIKYKSINLGIAVAAPKGLIVPNIKNAGKMGILEISNVSAGLFEKAREGKLSPPEYTGGTFTISNLGMFGIENFTAIINPPEMGILAISATKDEPYVVTNKDGTKEITIKPMMNITLSTDHRVIDGLLAAQFVTEIKTLLEHPISLLI